MMAQLISSAQQIENTGKKFKGNVYFLYTVIQWQIHGELYVGSINWKTLNLLV